MNDRLTDSDLMALRDTKRKMEVWERHGQTIMLFVVTAALAFTGKFIWEVNTALTKAAAEQKADRERFNEAIVRFDATLTIIQNQYVTQRQFEGYVERLRALEESNRKK